MSTLFGIDYLAGEPEIFNGTLISREIFEISLDRFARINPMIYQSLFLYSNNSKEYVIYVKDRNLVPIDLTGASAKMTFRATKSNPNIALELTGTIPVPTQGEVRFNVLPSDTETLEIRQYVFDVQITTAASKIYTVLEGVLTLKQSVST